jgi:tetratricopeptide (TPR) repeat protein
MSWGAPRFRAASFAFVVAVAASCAVGFAAPRSACAQAAPASQADQARAVELFEKGRAAYREGRFSDSVSHLREAYALVPEPVLLYNLARAHEGLGEYPEAIDAYERYLATAKDIPDRGAIERKLVSLRRELEERERLARERDEALNAKREPGEGSTSRSDPQPASAGASPWPWVVAGLGGAVLVGGGVFGSMALSTNDDAELAPSQLEAASLRDDAEGLATISTVGFVVGGVLLATGVTWGVIDLATSGSPGEATAHLELGPTGGRLRIHF